MGIFSKKSSGLASLATSGYAAPNQISGLFSPSTLAQAVFPDVDSSRFPVSLEEALSVPAVGRAVGLYSGSISRLPIDGPEWLTKTEGAITPAIRIASTVQDLIFLGGSVWAVIRDADGYVEDAQRVHPSRWSIDTDGSILVDGKPTTDKDTIYIASLLPEGFLSAGRDSIRHYSNLARTINNRSSVPEPAIILNLKDDSMATPEEIDEAVERLQDTLTHGRGGIVVTPGGLEVTGFGGSDSANSMMLEARMAVRTDLANHLQIDAAMLNGSTGANDVYKNALQSRDEISEFSFKLFSQPIADRLSQDDVTAPGTAVTFDYSDFESQADAAGNTMATDGEETAPAALTADDILKLTNAAGTLVRSGFDPESALKALGLPTIKHLGLAPVNLQKAEELEPLPLEEAPLDEL